MATGVIEFTVVGTPRPKGSTRAFMDYKNARVRVTSDNVRLKEWERSVFWAAKRIGLREQFAGPVALHAVFYLPRPDHAGASVANRPEPTVKPDLSKLLRGIEDPLSGLLFRDDAQVCRLSGEKRYCVGTEEPGAVITLRAL